MSSLEAHEREEGLRNERHLAAAARVLFESGHNNAAGLLLDVTGLRYLWLEEVLKQIDFDRREYENGWDARIECEPWVVARKSDEDHEAIHWALERAALRDDVSPVIRLSFVPIDNDLEWRAGLNSALTDKSPMTNSARGYPLDPVHPRADRMVFRSQAEFQVYKSLKRAQARRPPNRTIGIMALPMLNVPTRTWELDLVITLEGRVGVVEVDGPSHRGMDKRSAERSKDRLLEDAGVALIEHIDAQATDDTASLDTVVERFLERLAPRQR